MPSDLEGPSPGPARESIELGWAGISPSNLPRSNWMNAATIPNKPTMTAAITVWLWYHLPFIFNTESNQHRKPLRPLLNKIHIVSGSRHRDSVSRRLRQIGGFFYGSPVTYRIGASILIGALRNCGQRTYCCPLQRMRGVDGDDVLLPRRAGDMCVGPDDGVGSHSSV